MWPNPRRAGSATHRSSASATLRATARSAHLLSPPHHPSTACHHRVIARSPPSPLSRLPGPHAALLPGLRARLQLLGPDGRCRAAGGDARARSHRRFAPPLTHFLPDPLTCAMPLFLKRRDAAEPQAMPEVAPLLARLGGLLEGFAPERPNGCLVNWCGPAYLYSHGRRSHSRTTLYISLAILYKIYTGGYDNGCRVHSRTTIEHVRSGKRLNLSIATRAHAPRRTLYISLAVLCRQYTGCVKMNSPLEATMCLKFLGPFLENLTAKR